MRARICLLLVGILLLAACASQVAVVSEPSSPAKTRGGPAGAETHRSEAARPSTAATLGIPPGHLPSPGECRVWLPGRPPGHQQAAGRCSTLRGGVPPGAWLVYRPEYDRKHVEVTVYDEARPRVVVAVRLYQASTGLYVGEVRP
jgi:hypothetical protein